ncbi:MAG: ectonucleotide pyrophosphatase/phosphodiesterase [Prevotellaceae bacterium]|jgi:alkaline phosphatase D|nr:ectonucleotide pyrophosphatase/phosphodiesterase [Prevotellaceae bacterium]
MNKIYPLLFVLLAAMSACKQEKPYLVVLSMDGFRWDYCDLYDTPNLNKIRQHGVKAEYVQSSYPTVTFPNHYTMATGLYPDHHGVVNNVFYDAALGDTFSLSRRDKVENPAYWGGEPIWVTAKAQGVNSAVFFWPGSEAPVKGVYADFWKKYDGSVPFEQRIDTVVSWLTLPPAIRPHLILWYFSEPDHTGHKTGPDNDKTRAVVQRLDSLTGVFMDKISRLPHAGKVNVIITSDHGMAATAEERTIYLSDYLKPEWIERQFCYTVGLLYTKPEHREAALGALQNVPHLRAFKKEALPERLHYGANPRVGDIVVIPDCGWLLANNRQAKPSYGGAHGYDNECSDMRMIYFAYGPAFKQGYAQPPMSNVDVYNIMSAILHLKPAPNDGNFERVKEMLVN